MPERDGPATALERLDKLLPGRRVETDLPENLPLVPLDPILMELVFINLIENALRHAPGDGAIEISARERMDSIEISVADRGPGLAAEDLDRVFEKFYRANKAAGGAGLGLSIAHYIARAHNGRIDVASEVGRGTTFSVWLPLAKPAVKARAG